MHVVGLNLGETQSGKGLKDGGLFVVDTNSGRKVFFSEERVSGAKHAGGYEESANLAIQAGVLKDPDIVFYSSCCEPMVSSAVVKKHPRMNCDWVPVRHHDSHAAVAYRCSRFEQALILVADGGGNVLCDEKRFSEEWWRASREQFTYYIGDSQAGISLLAREFEQPLELGLGEFWRNITYLLGFRSSSNAAKVMELAAFSPAITLESPYSWSGDRIECRVKNDPTNPIGVAKQLLVECGVDVAQLELKSFEVRTRLAAWAQRVLENSIIDSLSFYKNCTGARNLCLGGGTMLNCRLVQRIRQSKLFDDIYVSYAPSDKGQAIGNVLWGTPSRHFGRAFYSSCYDPFMGTNHKTNVAELSRALGDEEDFFLISPKPDYRTLRELLKSGAIVATCFGRSEVGARALGNRSILASPDTPGIKEKLNEIKGRPNYNPVAPSCTLGYAEQHFSAPPHGVPYMSETVECESGVSVPDSMLHVDGTARLQTISNSKSSFLSLLCDGHETGSTDLQDFALLNTSFNRNGKPIVETPVQAVSEFLTMQLDCLVLSSHVIRKKNASLEFVHDKALDDPAEDLFAPSEFESVNYPNYWVERRESFSLFKNYIDWLKQGRKITTIRYMNGALSVPNTEILPLVMTSSFSQTSANVDAERVKVHGIKVKKFGDLDQRDAQRDGFKKTAHLKSTLKTIYPTITDDSLVTINFISIA